MEIVGILLSIIVLFVLVAFFLWLVVATTKPSLQKPAPKDLDAFTPPEPPSVPENALHVRQLPMRLYYLLRNMGDLPIVWLLFFPLVFRLWMLREARSDWRFMLGLLVLFPFGVFVSLLVISVVVDALFGWSPFSSFAGKTIDSAMGVLVYALLFALSVCLHAFPFLVGTVLGLLLGGAFIFLLFQPSLAAFFVSQVLLIIALVAVYRLRKRWLEMIIGSMVACASVSVAFFYGWGWGILPWVGCLLALALVVEWLQEREKKLMRNVFKEHNITSWGSQMLLLYDLLERVRGKTEEERKKNNL